MVQKSEECEVQQANCTLNTAKVICLVGAPKSGKSVSAATFPDPILYLDLEDGFKSAITMNKITGIKDKKVTHVRLGPGEIAGLEIRKDVPKDGKGIQSALFYTCSAPKIIAEYNKAITGVIKGKYKTVVIDALDDFMRIWKDAIRHVNGIVNLRIQDYGTLEGLLFSQFIPQLKALPVDYVIVINHLDWMKDELSGQLIEFPIGTSQNTGRQLSGAFDDVWLQEVINETVYRWQTKRSGYLTCGSRFDLPSTISPATYKKLKELAPEF
jgi:hypothetical protein